MLAMTSLQETANKTGWVWYLLVVLIVLGAILWWMYSQTKKQQKEQQQQKEQPPTEPKKQMVSEASELPDQKQKRGEKDDLTKIEGIGPKVAKVLSGAGITSFDSLAEADPVEVKSVLNDAGLQMMSPEGWIEQAQFAAREDWDGLQKLQDELKGGRRR